MVGPLPQRRHRKMLRDGSCEVWPEDAEAVFLDGLKEYWRSPWANYSRGRSRWRNQYLVDYLAKHGITRSKKQVASHIQVLRNMWKGHPEFQLVAGPEELYSDDHSSAATSNSDALSHASSYPPSSSRRHSRSSFSAGSPPSTPHSNDSEPLSDASFSLSNGSTRQIKQDPSLNITRVAPLHHPHAHPVFAPSLPVVADSDTDMAMSGMQVDGLEISHQQSISSQQHHPTPVPPPSMPSAFQTLHTSYTPFSSAGSSSVGVFPRISGFSLWSGDAMPPKFIDLDKFGSITSSGSTIASRNDFSSSAPVLQSAATINPSQLSMDTSPTLAPAPSLASMASSPSSLPPGTPAVGDSESPQLSTPTPRAPAPQREPIIRTSLRFELYMPLLSDARSSQTVSGFNGALFFAAPLPADANPRCLTQVHVGDTCFSKEMSPLIMVPSESQFSDSGAFGGCPDGSNRNLDGNTAGVTVSGAQGDENRISDSDGSRSYFVQSQSPHAQSQQSKYSALLPNSWLTRCRVLDTGSRKPIVITQQVIVSQRPTSHPNIGGPHSSCRSRSLSAPVAVGSSIRMNGEDEAASAPIGLMRSESEMKFQASSSNRDEALFVVVYYLNRGETSLPNAELTFWKRQIGEESVSSTAGSTGFGFQSMRGGGLIGMPPSSSPAYQGYSNSNNCSSVNPSAPNAMMNSNQVSNHFVNAFNTFPSTPASSSSPSSLPPSQQRAQPQEARVVGLPPLEHAHSQSHLFSGERMSADNAHGRAHNNMIAAPRVQQQQHQQQHSASPHYQLASSYSGSAPTLSFYSSNGEAQLESQSLFSSGSGGYGSVNGGGYANNGHYSANMNVGGYGGGMNGMTVGGGIAFESWGSQGAMPLLPLF